MTKKQIVYSVIGIIALLGTYFIMQIPLGLRQNNPGNIRRTSDDWQGLTLTQKGDFFTFKNPKWGYRAMARILRNYQRRGLNTVQAIISTWAPSVENNTESYVQHVSSFIGIDANQTINVNDYLPEL